MALGQYSHHVGANLVGHITVGGNAVCTNYYRINFAVLHQMPRHVVGDEGDRNIFLNHLPGGESRTLQKRAGLISNHRYFFARLHR